jgi:hypothetical protein
MPKRAQLLLLSLKMFVAIRVRADEEPSARSPGPRQALVHLPTDLPAGLGK